MNKTIFLLWLQGWENAPYLQKEVAKSWEIQNPTWKVEYVTLSNLKQYVTDIDYIYDKTKQFIPQTISDIIRISLLYNHGGVWADATMLCMQPLDGWVNDNLLFNNIWMYYRKKGGAEGTKALYSFIIANKGSDFIARLKLASDEYWRTNNRAHTYFWIDFLMNKIDSREFDNMPRIEADTLTQSHGLAGKINNVEKMELNIPEFKTAILNHPPYVLKLWKQCNINNRNSNASYAIAMSKRIISKVHPFETTLTKMGTNYGGWYIPEQMNLNADSIVYSGGAGEDISFDIKLQSKYGCTVILIDPTKKALDHYNEALAFFGVTRAKFAGNIQPDYYAQIQTETPNFDKIKYMNLGLWNIPDTLKFYKQSNENYVSQSLIENMFGDNYDLVPVDTIGNIMAANGHTKIDLLKLDIEGAEINVISKMLDDGIYPKYLLVEFDLLLKQKDPKKQTHALIDRLLTKEGYRMLKNDKLNITFSRV